MKYKLQDIIDIEHFQNLQDRLNEIYSFPSAIIDNDGNILTATAWQEICTEFHRKNKEAEKHCIKSDQYIIDHLPEANPAVSYRCPHGLVDNATPIIIEGVHYGNFFTGQFSLEEPDLEFFREQAKKYGFDEEAYLKAVKKVPVWTQKQLDNYLFFIKGLIAVISESGLKNLKEIENRKKAEVSEAQINTVLQTAMDGYWLTDSEGHMLKVNDSYCRMSGYKEQELLSMSISDIEVIESSQDTAEHLIKTMTQGEDRFESVHRRKDGSTFDVEISVKYIPTEGGRYVTFLRDITKRKQDEESLKAENSRFTTVMNSLDALVYAIDIETFKVIYINDYARKTFGDILGETCWQFIQTGQTGQCSFCTNDKLFDKKGNPIGPYVWEFQNTINGEWYQCHDQAIQWPDGRMARIEIATNITKIKQSEEKLKRSEYFLKASQKVGQIGSYYLTLNSGVWSSSETLNNIFEIDEHYTTDVNGWAQIIHPDDRAEMDTYFQNEVLGNKQKFDREYRIVAIASQREKWVHGYGELTIDDNGVVTEMIGTIQDITERKISEIALQHSHDLMDYVIAHNRSAIAIHDRDMKYIYVSQRYLDEYKIKEKNIIGRHHYDIFPDLPQKWRDVHQRVLAGEILSAENDSYPRDDGTVEWTRWECRPWYEAEGTIGGLIVYTEVITESIRAENALRVLAEIGNSGENIFQLLVRELAVSLNVKYALIAELKSDDMEKAHTIAVWDNNSIIENFIYELRNTPCQNVTEEGAVLYPSQVQTLFPDDHLLVEMSAESYWGTPLRNSAGKVIGILAILDEKVIVEQPQTLSLLNSFAIRASSELERMRAEDDLKKNQHYQEKAQELGSIGSWELNLRTNKLIWTKENYKIFGVPIGKELTSEIFRDLVHPDDKDYVDKKWTAALNREPYDIDHRILVNDTIKWVREKADVDYDDEGNPYKAIGFTQDITSRKNTEKELQEQKNKLESVIGAMAPGLSIMDNNFNITFQSSSITEYFGYHVGEKCYNIFENNDEVCEECPVKLCFEDGETHTSLRKVTLPNGKTTYWENVASPIKDSDGNIASCLEIANEVTDRLLMEEQLRIRERMDSVGALASGIAHDFNNLLAGIMGNMELLRIESQNLTSEQKEFLEESYKLSQNAARLVKNLQSLTSTIASESKSVDIHKVAQDVFSILERTTDRLIEKRLDIPPSTFIVEGHYDQLHQVMLNLGTNAIHAIEEKGVNRGDFIRISARESGSEEAARRGFSAASSYHILVEDTGVGMSDEVTRRAFEPLFTTKDRGTQKGQGLGLAMVYNIITKNHKGTIDIESEKGKGTKFHIFLPKAEAQKTEESTEMLKAEGGSETILIVEDEVSVIRLAEKALRRYGYYVMTSADGEAGLNLYKKNHEGIDLVILDLTLPKMSGKMVLDEILKVNPEAKVVISSGQSPQEIETHTQAKGFVAKPYKLDDLAKTIRDVLDV